MSRDKDKSARSAVPWQEVQPKEHPCRKGRDGDATDSAGRGANRGRPTRTSTQYRIEHGPDYAGGRVHGRSSTQPEPNGRGKSFRRPVRQNDTPDPIEDDDTGVELLKGSLARHRPYSLGLESQV